MFINWKISQQTFIQWNICIFIQWNDSRIKGNKMIHVLQWLNLGNILSQGTNHKNCALQHVKCLVPINPVSQIRKKDHLELEVSGKDRSNWQWTSGFFWENEDVEKLSTVMTTQLWIIENTKLHTASQWAVW